MLLVELPPLDNGHFQIKRLVFHSPFPPLNYCSVLGTYFSSLLIFWISDRLTAGPGSFFAPGIGFFSSSEVGGAPWKKKERNQNPGYFISLAHGIEQENKYQKKTSECDSSMGTFSCTYYSDSLRVSTKFPAICTEL